MFSKAGSVELKTMLKITNNNESGDTTIKLEGKLTGEWVNELSRCWQENLLTGNGHAISLDLTGVTWVSDEGKALLGVMHRTGAVLLAANLLVAGVIAEIISNVSANDASPVSGQ